jgi:hypothetical protein
MGGHPRIKSGAGSSRRGFAAHLRVTDRLSRRSARFAFLPHRRRVEQHAAEAFQLAILEQADHAILAVIAGFADHFPGAQARDRLGES